jgi:hypothetical protein
MIIIIYKKGVKAAFLTIKKKNKKKNPEALTDGKREEYVQENHWSDVSNMT